MKVFLRHAFYIMQTKRNRGTRTTLVLSRVQPRGRVNTIRRISKGIAAPLATASRYLIRVISQPMPTTENTVMGALLFHRRQSKRLPDTRKPQKEPAVRRKTHCESKDFSFCPKQILW